MNRVRIPLLGSLSALTTGTISFSEQHRKRYTRDEVAEFDGKDGNRFYVTYRGHVYDLTDFHSKHPGGSLIEQAAGSDVEQFWAKWAYHFDSKQVERVLNDTQIGILDTGEDEAEEGRNSQLEESYEKDPTRDFSKHDVCSLQPFCSQTDPNVLSDSYITDTNALYVRNHAPVPLLDATTHKLRLMNSESTSTPALIPLNELSSRFGDPVEVISVLQCAGNRQTDDFKASGANGFTGGVYETLQNGMVGNIKWKGYRLDRILLEVYPNECKSVIENKSLEVGKGDDWHVIFSGADEYETSSPLSLLLDPDADCLLAVGMNEGDLTRDHGYPIRAILPGIAGCRNVKYLESIRLSRTPCDSPWNAHYYKEADGKHIQKLPLQSILLLPKKNTLISENEDGFVKVKGVAYTGAERSSINKVEITIDNGKTWSEAKLLWEDEENMHDDDDDDDDNGDQHRHRHHHHHHRHRHAWVRFESDVAIPKDNKNEKIYIYSKATDSNGLAQPKYSPKQRGYLYNGWGKTSLLKSC